MSYIYKITNIKNDKIYIGKTNNTIEKRFQKHCQDSKILHCENRPLYKAMNKYGVNNFKVEKVEECSPETASEREKYWSLKADITASNSLVIFYVSFYYFSISLSIQCDE